MRSSCFGLQVNSSVFSWPRQLSSSCWTRSAPTKPELLFGCQGAESWSMVIQDTALGGRTGFLVRQCEEGGCEPPLSLSPPSLSKELSVVAKCHSDMSVQLLQTWPRTAVPPLNRGLTAYSPIPHASRFGLLSVPKQKRSSFILLCFHGSKRCIRHPLVFKTFFRTPSKSNSGAAANGASVKHAGLYGKFSLVD